jgi:hypothetical protein
MLKFKDGRPDSSGRPFGPGETRTRDTRYRNRLILLRYRSVTVGLV